MASSQRETPLVLVGLDDGAGQVLERAREVEPPGAADGQLVARPDAEAQATWDFLDRRIDQVMQIEKLKASFRENPFGKAWMAGPGKLFETIRAPKLPDDLPGRTRG